MKTAEQIVNEAVVLWRDEQLRAGGLELDYAIQVDANHDVTLVAQIGRTMLPSESKAVRLWFNKIGGDQHTLHAFKDHVASVMQVWLDNGCVALEYEWEAPTKSRPAVTSRLRSILSPTPA